MKQLAEVLLWGGFYAIPYFVLPKSDQDQLRIPTAGDWFWDVFKLVTFIFAVYALVKVIKGKWRF